MADSGAIKKDFEAMRQGRLLRHAQKQPADADRYLAFVTFANAFANHAPKPFYKIKNSNFKL